MQIILEVQRDPRKREEEEGQPATVRTDPDPWKLPPVRRAEPVPAVPATPVRVREPARV
jgi:hypothetical protein